MSRERFVGCLLGLAVGDAVAAPYEGVPAEHILEECGPTPEIIAQAGNRTLRYTDDTEMTIGVAEVLAECGEIDEAALVSAFARNYEPRRGYGSGARRVIEAMQAGADWRAVATNHFPRGSYGNGAAMRVAPVGAHGGEIPGRLIAALEDGPRGRSYLHQLAEGLHDRLVAG